MGIESLESNLKKPKSEGLEFFNLDAKQKKELASKVSESGGLVRIFIHPISGWTSDEITENQDRVTQVLKRTIYSEKSPPIIILENDHLAEQWKKIFENTPPPKDIYIVPTIWNFSYPIVPNNPNLPERDEEGRLKQNTETDKYITEGFIKLIETLNEAGVKKILLGGTKLEIEDGHLYRCVGNFINMLQDLTRKEIKLSLGTAPLNRNDLRKSRPDLI